MVKKLKPLIAFFAVLFIVVSVVNVCGSAAKDENDYYTFNGNAYTVLKVNNTYNGAQNFCAKNGGHILYINTASEQTFIRATFPYGKYWLGATYSPASKSWTWGGGSEVVYSNWVNETPDSATEGYAFIDTSTGKWNNTNRSSSYYVICEIEGAASKVTSRNETNYEYLESTTEDDDPLGYSTAPSSDVSGTQETGVPESADASNSEVFTSGRQTVSIVYIRETVASGFTLPTAPSYSVTQQENTTSILSDLDIGDTIYIYEDTFYYQIANASEILISYYIGLDSDVTIPQSIDGMPVKYIGQRSFQSTKLDSVTIPSSVSAIEKTAFCNVSENFTVYGEKDTYVQSFAKANKFNFEEISFLGADETSVDGENVVSNGKKGTDTKLTVTVAALIAVVIAAASIAFLVVRREKILSAMDEDEQNSDDESEFSVEYDDGSEEDSKEPEKQNISEEINQSENKE